jgi:hypothetical protein
MVERWSNWRVVEPVIAAKAMSTTPERRSVQTIEQPDTAKTTSFRCTKLLGAFRRQLRLAQVTTQLLALVVVIGIPAIAHAELGGMLASVEKDRAFFKATRCAQTLGTHSVHELLTSRGSRIREYVSKNGKIFAVTWSGGFRPNLRQLMGAYYNGYIQATKGRPVARGPHRVELPGMVVLLGGHGRAFFGKVVLTNDLPSGLRLEDVK